MTNMIQRTHIVIAMMAAILWLSNCTSKPKEQINDAAESTEMKDSVAQIEPANNYQTPKDFQMFWKEFRQAVLDADSIELLQMTVFPLKTHGHQDFDPRIDINKSDFYKVLKMGLNEGVSVEFDSTGINGTSVTSFEMIKKTMRVKEDKEYLELVPGGWYRVENMEFTRTDLGWKLELIYLDTRELKKKLNR